MKNIIKLYLAEINRLISTYYTSARFTVKNILVNERHLEDVILLPDHQSVKKHDILNVKKY